MASSIAAFAAVHGCAGRAAAEEAHDRERELVAPGRRRAPAEERSELEAAAIAALAALDEPVPARMVVGLAGGAEGREVAEARLPADDVGAVCLQRVCRGDEVGREEPLVDQLEVLPH